MRWRRGSAWLVALLALLPHLRGLANGFVYDDFRFFVENPGVQSLAHPWELVASVERMSSPLDQDIWRPLRTLLFAAEHALFCSGGGAGHLCNRPWLWHATSLLLLLLLVRGVIAVTRRLPGVNERTALLGGLLFGLHPLTVESVAWVSSQGDLIAAAAAVGCLVFAATRPWLASALCIVALLGKESALPLVGVLLVARWRGPEGLRPQRAVVIIAVLATGLYLVTRQHVVARGMSFDAGGFSQLDAPWSARLVTVARNLLFALRLFVKPWPLSIDYDVTSYTPALLFEHDTVVLLIAAALLAALGWGWARARSPAALAPPLLTALLFFVPTFGLFVVMKSPMADRYLLLPTAGLAIAAALLITHALRRPPPLRWSLRHLLGAAALVAMTGWNSVCTWQRTSDFTTDERLWQAELARNPGSIQARLGLLQAATEHGDLTATTALALDVVSATPAGDPRRLLALFTLGQQALDREQHDDGVRFLERCRHELETRAPTGAPAPGLSPQLHLVYVALGNEWRTRFGPAAAQPIVEAGLARFGRQPRLLELLGVVRDQQCDATQALALYAEALDHDGESVTLRYHSALAFLHAQQPAAARIAAERALALDPSYAPARKLLAELTQ